MDTEKKEKGDKIPVKCMYLKTFTLNKDNKILILILYLR